MTHVLASVIIPTFNGKDKVIQLLKSLEKQTVSSFEIIVVIDGSTDGSLQYIQSFEWNLNELRLIEQTNKGRAGARNTGAHESKTQLLIFFDDDMLLDPACIEKHIQFHQQHASSIAMGKIIEPATSGDAEIVHYKDFLNASWNQTLEAYKQKALPPEWTILSAANFSISKSDFDKLNGFDEVLKDIEDYDFALRVKQQGTSIYYLDDAVSVHKDPFTFQKYADRSRSYLKNRKYAAQLKPALYANDPILNHKKTVLQKLVYAFFKYAFWLRLLDHCNVFVVLPKKLRYKIYGIIFTAFIHNQQ
jgi:glycosyltransferase involved in cell wall biosynthesis